MVAEICRRLLLAVAFFCGAVYAQQSVPPKQSSSGKIYLDVVVTSKSGAPASSLQRQDFTLLDNKVPKNITSFRAVDGRQAPIDVIVLIDAVNTDYHTIAYERGEIDKFLRADGGHLAHPTKLAFLTDSGIQIQEDFSTDGNSLSASLDQHTVSLRGVARSAGFYGAVERFQLSLNGLHELVVKESEDPGRKIILCVSPGWPLLSGQEVELDAKQQKQIFASIVGISTELLRDRTTLYSIDPSGAGAVGFRTFYWQSFVKGVSKPSQAQGGNLGLQVLATQSGGIAFSPSNAIAALLQRCLADVGAYYEVSFDSSTGERPNEYHRLEIHIAEPGLTARTRQGYYSDPNLSWGAGLPAPIETGNGIRP
jgi:VWFA-related protein